MINHPLYKVRGLRPIYAPSILAPDAGLCRLSVMQYRYCGLPIVAPNFLDLHREGVFYYKPSDAASCRAALIGALQSGRNTAYAEEVHTWREVAEALL